MALPVDLPIILLRWHATHQPSEYPVALSSGDGHGWYEWIGSSVGDSQPLLDKAREQIRTFQDCYASDYQLGILAGGRMAILGQCFPGTKAPQRTCVSCGLPRDSRLFEQYGYGRTDGSHGTKKVCRDCINARNRERRKARESQGALLEH
jgi:hypothetical protein